MENTKNLFGDNLRRLVDANESSYEAAAEALEISISFLQQLMRGERDPSLKTVRIIRNRYKVTFNDLLEKTLSAEEANLSKNTVGEMAPKEFFAQLSKHQYPDIERLRALEARIKKYGPDLLQAIEDLDILKAERVRLVLKLPALTVVKPLKKSPSVASESPQHLASKKKVSRQ